MTAGGRLPLVLLHGWGMGPSAFVDWRARLEARRPVHCPSWSRHVEASYGAGQGDRIDRIADRVTDAVEAPAHWVGWSLGGLIAIAAARRAPAAVGRVTLIASSPRMASGPDWPGIDRLELERFRRELEVEPMATHDRFLTLQVRGSRGGRSVLRALRSAVAADGLPSMGALMTGLDQLRQSDLRSDLDALSCPVDVVLGECDSLVPVAVAGHLEALGVAVRIIPDAAHAPFISHPDAVTDALLDTGVTS